MADEPIKNGRIPITVQSPFIGFKKDMNGLWSSIRLWWKAKRALWALEKLLRKSKLHG